MKLPTAPVGVSTTGERWFCATQPCHKTALAWLAGAIYNRDQASARFNNAAIHINAVLPGGPSIRSTGGIFNEPSGSVEIGNSIVAPNAAPDADNNLVEADCMGTIEFDWI